MRNMLRLPVPGREQRPPTALERLQAGAATGILGCLYALVWVAVTRGPLLRVLDFAPIMVVAGITAASIGGAVAGFACRSSGLAWRSWVGWVATYFSAVWTISMLLANLIMRR